MAQNPLGTLSPEEAIEQQRISRQQQMANLLMQQGMQQPQGQMISGRYVPPSIFQNLAGLANVYVGRKQLQEADQRQLDLAQRLREGREIETKAIMDKLRGPEIQTEMAGPYTADIPKPVLTSRGPADIQGAMDLAMRSRYGAGQALLPTLIEKSFLEPRKPMVVAPGATVVDEQGKVIYQAPFKPEAGTGIGEDGGYNKKGDWITPNGIFIGKSEVSKDREIAFTADQVRQGLKQITPEDVKKAASVFGSVTGSGPINYLVQQAGNPAVAAQTKINASSVMQILNNLPPGPASDKDIENARSTFPGYGNERALNDWIKNTRETLDRKVNSLNQKYGSENWYGNVGLKSTPQTEQSGGGGVVDFNALPKRK